MIHRNKFLIAATIGLCSTALSSGASLSISGNNFNTLMDSADNPLAAGSILQVGYFLGIDTETADPGAFGKTQWDTFTALTGPFSLNTSLTAVTENLGGPFPPAIYRLDMTIDDESADANAKTFPPFASLIGIRVFDTTDPSAIGSADYNTATSRQDSWTATGPDGVGGTGVVLGMAGGGTATNPDLFWEFNSSPFQTVAIPEPSSSLSLLLGVGLLLGARRRK